MTNSAGAVVASADNPGARFEQELPLELVMESPHNPRKRFDPAQLEALAQSIREKGVLTPVLVREAGNQHPEKVASCTVYELAAGHRRSRAARMAGLSTIPAVIRTMTDQEFLEVLVIENDQREDVHAFEEASGYQALLGLPGYDVGKIAARVGRSPKFVYDRLKLLDLIPKAQELFLREAGSPGSFSAGHAILLARLKPQDQLRAIDVTRRNGYSSAIDSGLFQSMSGSLFDDETESKDPYDQVKAVSVREFEAWIQRNIRFEPAHVDAFLFPETAQAIEAHADDRLGVILGTRQYRASDDVRGAGKEKVFGAEAWKRADGQEKSKTCDWSRLLLIACGPGQGETFLACVNKEKCATHWSAWQKERKASQRRAAVGGSGSAEKRQATEQAARAQREAAERKEEDLQARWKKATPAMLEALAGAVKKAPIGRLVKEIVNTTRMPPGCNALMPAAATAEDLVRRLAFVDAAHHSNSAWEWDRREFAKGLKAFGLDAMAILNQAAPAEKPKPALTTSAKPGKPVKGTCRKCGCQEDTPCASGCGWADGTKTRCTACFPPKLKSAAKKAGRR